MNTKVVWKLSDDEYKEIEDLFERKIALENLSKIVDVDNEKLYEKLIGDYGKALRQFNGWWDIMSKKHNWEGKNWTVDFESKQVLGDE